MEAVRIADSLSGVDRDEWNALAGPQPFMRHEFLSALIDTGCAAAGRGWAPQFVLLSRAGSLVGADVDSYVAPNGKNLARTAAVLSVTKTF